MKHSHPASRSRRDLPLPAVAGHTPKTFTDR
jgi:hypothetical protein